MIKEIIFDMDGVLLDTEPLHYQAWKTAFEYLDISLTLDDYQLYCQAQGRKHAILNMKADASPDDIAMISRIKGQTYLDLIEQKHIPLYPDALALLDRMHHKHISASVASSSVTAIPVLRQSGCSHYFKAVTTGNDIERNKPYPDIFIKAAKKTHLPLKELIVVEDSIAGIIAARLAGLKVYGLNRHQSLARFNTHNIQIHIQDLNMKITPQESRNLHETTTILINSLNEISL